MIKVDGVWHEAPIHAWFGLTYSAYFCIPRSALEAMPYDWQQRFVALVNEANETGLETPTYSCQRRDETGKFIKDEWADYRRPKIDHLLPDCLKKDFQQPETASPTRSGGRRRTTMGLSSRG